VLLLVAILAASTPEAAELEGRLLAPCCYKQTLDIHASPLADQVRDRIRRRAEAGEAIEAIEADLVKEFGEKIRAIPRAGFLTPMGVSLTGAGIFALIALFVLARRRLVKPVEAAPPAAVVEDESYAALKRELADLD